MPRRIEYQGHSWDVECESIRHDPEGQRIVGVRCVCAETGQEIKTTVRSVSFKWTMDEQLVGALARALSAHAGDVMFVKRPSPFERHRQFHLPLAEESLRR